MLEGRGEGGGLALVVSKLVPFTFVTCMCKEGKRGGEGVGNDCFKTNAINF